jgi:multidrug efflux system membrane fusion protein
VSFAIPAGSIGSVIGKDHRKLVVDAWDRDSSTKLTSGTLWAVDNQVDPATGTVKLKALFGNKDSSLFPNQFVNVQLFVDTLKSVILVPSAALQKSPQGNFVYVVKENSTVEMRLVEVLVSQGDQTALKSGISAGETVVTDGIERLKPGAAITIPAAQTQQGGGAPEAKGKQSGGERSLGQTQSQTQGSGKAKP